MLGGMPTNSITSTLIVEPIPPDELHRIMGRIAAGVLVDNGDHAVAVIHDMFGRPDVAFVQLRNVGYGCHNFTVRRG
jgi:Protein of unknown function (DUF1203)